MFKVVFGKVMFVRFFWLILVMLNFQDERDEMVVDLIIILEKFELFFVLVMEIFRSFYQFFESLEDFDEIYKLLISFRKKLNEFLVCRDVSFICYYLKKLWNLVVDRIQCYYICKV